MEKAGQTNDWYRLKQGDKDAFMRLYDSCYQAMYSFGFRVYPDKDLVKDAIHEVFCEVWENREKFPDITNEKAYLITYLKRKILRELEKKYVSLSDDHVQAMVFERSYEALLIEQQTDETSRLQLKKSLAQLTPGQLEIIRLKYYEQLDNDEIAERLQLKPRTIYNQISLALRTLRQHIKILTTLFFLFF